MKTPNFQYVTDSPGAPLAVGCDAGLGGIRESLAALCLSERIHCAAMTEIKAWLNQQTQNEKMEQENICALLRAKAANKRKQTAAKGKARIKKASKSNAS